MDKCQICQENNFELIATRIREGEGRILRCRKCGLIMQGLDWETGRLRDYYEDEYQSTNSLISGKKQSAREHFAERLRTIKPLFGRIKPLLSTNMTILEIGCGPGTLLHLCKPLVKKCVGTELNSRFINFMKEKLGIEGYAEDINKLELKDKFDRIIIINTLDHLPSPLETLLTVKKLLSKKGMVYLEVPNRDEALNFFLPEPQLSDFRKFFWHRAHFFYFSRGTITALFKKAGFSVKVTNRHEYTLKNYLNWYFKGRPQPGFVSATTENELFTGKSGFEKMMNRMFLEMSGEFKKIIEGEFRGDTLCCTAKVKADR